MDIQIYFHLKSRLDSVNKAYLSDHMYRIISKFGKSFWVLLSTFFFNLFQLIINLLIRLKYDEECKNNSNSNDFCHENEEQRLNHGSTGLNFNGFGEKENSEFYFGFNFQFRDVFDTRIEETESSVLMEDELTMNTSKYTVESAKDIGVFMEVPKNETFNVQELFVGSNDFQKNVDSGIAIDKDFLEPVIQEDFDEFMEGLKFHPKGSDECNEFLKVGAFEEVEVKTEEAVFSEEEGLNLGGNEVSKKEQVNWLGDFFLNSESFSYGIQFLSENDFAPSDSNLESDDSSFGFSISPGEVDSGAYDLSQDDEENGNFIDNTLEEIKVGVSFIESPSKVDSGDYDSSQDEEKIESAIDNLLEKIKVGVDSGDYDSSQDEEEIESAIDNFLEKIKVGVDSGYYDLSQDDEVIESVIDNLLKEIKVGVSFIEEMDDRDKGQPNLDGPNLDEKEENEVEKSLDFDLEDEEDEEDVLLEHQYLVEQMKMELKNSRINGLPTILEECETAKMADDLKPLKIDEKIEHGDRMEEIQKFYKSYAERMRKLDVLNYQTSQAIGFLQMKNPVQLNSTENSAFSAIKSRILSGKSRRIYADPTLKSIGELQRDLEVVYVGQVCLSWEILRWQHGKAREFQEYDSEGIRSYNQVAGDFQQFQVLVQRFTEDETFEGPRMQNYVKKRGVLRTLLQVPTIKDDLKDKGGKRQDEDYAISMAMLADLIEESMRVFWSFLRADKDCANFITKTLHGSHASLQDPDPADLELLADIKTSLQKKEKRLKDILRSGNCLVKKFQKHQTARLDLPLFLTQVELRLVSRVLSLQRLSHDQLIWCRTKLNNINFVDRTKIRIEPLFLLFPC